MQGTRRFFLVAFAFTWALQIPGVLARKGLLPGDPNAYLPFAMLGIFGPTVAAIVETRREGGSVKALLLRLSPRGARPTDVLLALLPAALLTAGLYAFRLVGREGPITYFPDAGHLVGGVVISLAEELGWRGYALPRLERRYGAFGGSGVLGILWTLWHIPMLLAVGIDLSLLPVMLLFFVGGSLYFGFLMKRSGASLFVAFIAHLAAHLNNAHASLPGDLVPLLVGTLVYASLGVLTMYPHLGARRRPDASPGSPSDGGSGGVSHLRLIPRR